MADGYSNDYGNANAYGPAQVPGTMGPDWSGITSAVQRLQSPYSSFGPTGWLQQHHPGIAGALDNVFLTAANIPQGRTIGENIGAVAHGLVAGRQMGLERQLQQAMLPMDIAQRQMAYQQAILNMNKTQAETAMYGSHAKFFGTMGDVRQQMADVAQQKADQAEEARYGGKLDPASKLAVDGVMKKYGVDKYSDLNADQIAEAQKQARQSKMRMGSLTAGDIIAMQMSEDPEEQAKGKQASKLYAGLFGMRTGAQTTAADIANQPKQTADDFLKSEKDRLATTLGKRPDPAEHKIFEQTATINQLMSGNPYDPSKIPTLEQRQAQYDQQAGEVKKRFSRYTGSNAWRKGRQFNPDEWGDQSQAAPQAAKSAIPGTVGPRPDLGTALDQIFPRQ